MSERFVIEHTPRHWYGDVWWVVDTQTGENITGYRQEKEAAQRAADLNIEAGEK